MRAEPDDGLIAPLVWSRYRQMGVVPGWTRERFIELCHLANRTPEEVGAFAGLSPTETRSAMIKGKFHPSASLHFAAIDAAVKEANYGDPAEPLVPLNLLSVNQQPNKETCKQQ